MQISIHIFLEWFSKSLANNNKWLPTDVSDGWNCDAVTSSSCSFLLLIITCGNAERIEYVIHPCRERSNHNKWVEYWSQSRYLPSVDSSHGLLLLAGWQSWEINERGSGARTNPYREMRNPWRWPFFKSSNDRRIEKDTSQKTSWVCLCFSPRMQRSGNGQPVDQTVK